MNIPQSVILYTPGPRAPRVEVQGAVSRGPMCGASRNSWQRNQNKTNLYFAGSQLLAQVKQREHSDFWALSASSTQTSFTPPSPIIVLPCHSLALLKFVQILDLSKLLHEFI